jgi:hypothetical protein
VLYNFRIQSSVGFYSNFWRNSHSNRAKWYRIDAAPQRRTDQNAGCTRARAPCRVVPCHPRHQGPRLPETTHLPKATRAPRHLEARARHVTRHRSYQIRPCPRCPRRRTELLPAARAVHRACRARSRAPASPPPPPRWARLSTDFLS